ncbi:hypothetical protein MLD38_004720 [Melastoma candidum]|uniref:Uncharacterized protein n=1 Tax=Melastoma candidum TaxID=119954 RepID=A0ACB9S5T1_9MYRT|nr:hypothetical protein MLD38_004720 [Melastoma candidum]
MGIFSAENPWAFSFGLLGNVISFIVILAPAPTFYRVCKKKTTEGFQSIPYVVAMFSAMLWLYYASLKANTFLLVTINAVGCVVESIYIALYLVYAPRKARMVTLRLILLLNFGGFCSIVLLSRLFQKRSVQVQVLGWVCDVVAVSVFAAPLSVIRMVIRTKSVEFMPVLLSFFLMLSAVTWLLYGISLKDIYIALPNVLGVIFALAQIILYLIYRKPKKAITEGKVSTQAVVDTNSLEPQKQGVLDIESSGDLHAGNDNGQKDEPKQEECAEVKLQLDA